VEELMATVKASMDVIIPAVEEIRAKGVETTSVSHPMNDRVPSYPLTMLLCFAPEN
jgi:hypothetical protein